MRLGLVEGSLGLFGWRGLSCCVLPGFEVCTGGQAASGTRGFVFLFVAMQSHGHGTRPRHPHLLCGDRHFCAWRLWCSALLVDVVVGVVVVCGLDGE